jgi:uridine kinase
MKTEIIGIAGASASGKSTLARKLKERWKDDCIILSADAYYKDWGHLPLEERRLVNFDIPDSLDFDLLVKHIKTLKSGQNVFVPTYDFATHCRTTETKEIMPQKYIIVDGMLAFSDEKLLSEMDFKIYVDIELDICFSRRVLRDTQERGYDLPYVVSKYEKANRPMFLQYVLPGKEKADLVVDNNSADFSMDLNEIVENINLHSNRCFELPAQSRSAGTLFVISGPSAVGKSTIIRNLVQNPENNISRVVTYTTRQPRNGEVDGIDYHFANKDTINDLLASKTPLLEHIEAFGNHYWIPLEVVIEKLRSGKNLIIDLVPDAFEQAKKHVKNISIKSMFIVPFDVSELEKRMFARGDSDAQRNLRYNEALELLNKTDYRQYDCIIVNKNLEQSLTDAEIIIKQCQLTTASQRDRNGSLFGSYGEINQNPRFFKASIGVLMAAKNLGDQQAQKEFDQRYGLVLCQPR